MRAVSPKQQKTLVTILASPLSQAIERVVQEVMQCTGRPQECDALEEAVDIFLHGKVGDANIVMYDRTPMVKVNIRHRGKTYKIHKSIAFRHIIAHALGGNPLSEVFAEKILPLLPQDEVAMQLASIENSSAAALQDEKKLAPIRARFNTKRAADKERLMARIRDVFKDHDDLLSEDEVLQMWRETFAREVMES
jgi:hypothetical protein